MARLVLDELEDTFDRDACRSDLAFQLCSTVGYFGKEKGSVMGLIFYVLVEVVVIA